MFNIDDPGFPIALLAILVGVRLMVFAYERLFQQVPQPVAPTLSPDAPVEDVAIPEGELSAAAPPPVASTVSTPVRLLTEVLDAGIIAVVLVFFIIRPFVLQAFYIPSGSMIPTLQEGDKLLAAKYVYHLREPRRGEVVVFHAPPVALNMMSQRYDPQNPTEYVKRVVGIPGDRIRVVSGDGLYVNDERQHEPYSVGPPEYDFPLDPDGSVSVRDPVAREVLDPAIEGGELTIPPGYLFVLGDNRLQSHDSHIWGLLERKNVVGKAVFIFWPPARTGAIR